MRREGPAPAYDGSVPQLAVGTWVTGSIAPWHGSISSRRREEGGGGVRASGCQGVRVCSLSSEDGEWEFLGR